jgi:thioredoxin-like negative regulator of GroEL
LQISSSQQNQNQQQEDAFSRFMYGIQSDETRRKYMAKLEQFFDFYKKRGYDDPAGSHHG